MRSPGSGPWYVDVPGHRPFMAGEHPRLFFRKSQLPELRRRAATAEGRAILARLRQLLEGPLTIGHVAGYGLLYQLTGDASYAVRGRESFEQFLAGTRDLDSRYSYRAPGGALRAGPSIGWLAAGYDLCYDGWDLATREKLGRAIAEYREGVPLRGGREDLTLEALARGTMPPGSNHFGMQVGGAALALLALSREPWVDQPRVDRLLREVEASLVRNLSEGFGDGGFFAEGDGTGSMASQIVYLAALEGWRHAMGRDYAQGPRPNVRMMVLKWIYQTVYADGVPQFWPIRGGYPHNVWSREGLSGAAYFAQGFPHVRREERGAMKWIYERFLAQRDEAQGTPFDTASRYPQFAVASFLNWPIGERAQDPNQVLPRVYRDAACDFFCWRNRWRDANDTVITMLATETRGYMGAKPDLALAIHAGGRRWTWGTVAPGPVRHWASSRNGATSSLVFADGTAIGVDFTGASGNEVLLVTSGPAADGVQVSLGAASLTFYSPSATSPLAVRVKAGAAVVGRQRVRLVDGRIAFARPE